MGYTFRVDMLLVCQRDPGEFCEISPCGGLDTFYPFWVLERKRISQNAPVELAALDLMNSCSDLHGCIALVRAVFLWLSTSSTILSGSNDLGSSR